MNIGLFNGTFDPIHKGHTTVMEKAWAALQLDFIYVLPTNHPPHKPNLLIKPHHHRYAMVSLATQDMPYVKPLAFEVPGGFAYQELSAVKNLHSGADLYYILGLDSFITMESWVAPWVISKQVTEFIVATRPGYNMASIPITGFFNSLWSRTRFIECSMPVSSTDIRLEIDDPETTKLLHPPVLDYIKKAGLYRGESLPIAKTARTR